MKKTSLVFRGLTGLLAPLCIFAAVATPVAYENDGLINKALNVTTFELVDESTEDVDSAYYKSKYYETYGDDITSKAAALKLEKDVAAECVRQVEEGAVLLKNDNNALPLAAGSGITIFGNGAVHSAYNKSKESSTIAELPLVTFPDAMKQVYDVNTQVIDQYENMSGLARSNGTRVYEADISTVTSKASTWASGYNDAAVVVLTRWGSEDIDINMYDTLSSTDNRSILALHDNEIALLEYLQSQKGTGNGQFDRIIVVLNSDHPMELGALDEYGVDACLWAGVPGSQGFTGIANVMCGDVNPSGHLVDTYAANSRSAPANAYALENTQVWSNADEVNANCPDGADTTNYYTIYAEGIYVGYKYYETRYADAVAGTGGASSSAGSSTGSGWDYADEMTYTFGHGLSYTTFSQTLDGVTYDEDADEYTVTVTVTNTGSTAGKSVVQVYAQTPYGDYEKENGVEKSAVQIAGFEKTGILEAGKSETVQVVIDRYLLASYDSVGAKGYILSAGDYYFSVGDNAHDALNNILAEKGYGAEDGMVDMYGEPAEGNAAKVYKWTQTALDSASYRYSDQTESEVTNLFDFADINSYDGQNFTYLTRNDWENTFPKGYSGALTAGVDLDLRATDEMMEDINVPEYTMPEDAPKASEFEQAETELNESETLKFIMLKDVDFDSDFWETYLNQFTIEQLGQFMLDSSGGTNAMTSIAMPGSTRADDGVCIQQATLEATGQTCMAWPSEIMTSCTWNKECFTARGEMLAQEAFFCGANEVWYGGGNLHRTPFSGRNMQYYSEDGNYGYYVGWYEAQAMQKYGITYCIKHFALNDQEYYRQGLNTFATEQTLREQYFRAFEGAFCKGGVLGTMLGFNRIGCIPAMTCKAMVTDLLRGEWGFKGHVTPDAYTSSAYCDDNVKSAEIIKETVRSIFRDDIDCDIETFYSAVALKERFRHKLFDLIFLDIDMPQQDGISLAEELRMQRAEVNFIFVSNREDRVFDVFKVSPVGFVRKSKFSKDIVSVIEDYCSKILPLEDQKNICFRTRDGIVHVSVSDIMYIEGARENQIVHLAGKRDDVVVISLMSELESSLGKYGFLRVHKGYLVNCKYILRFTQKDIVLQDGVTVPVSRRRMSDIKRLYMRYVQEDGAIILC